jgi:UDP-3-O-[3-hydroxymyristoyl] glucosamine N-acyltransferase
VTLREIAEILGGRLDGDGAVEIRGVRPLESAEGVDLALVADAAHFDRLRESKAGALLLAETLPPADRPAVRTTNPHLSLALALLIFHPPRRFPPGVHPSAVLAPGVEIGVGATIGPHCVVEAGAVVGPGSVLVAQVYVGPGVRIGAQCLLYPQVSLYEGAVVGDRVILHAGAVVAADGFGYAREGERYVKIPQIGRVLLEDDVEVGANTCIDRATLEETRIGRGTKIDNLVQIGHNVRVGEDTVIVSQVGVSGSSRIGSRVTLAGQAGIVDHVAVGDGAIVGAQAGVPKDVAPGSVVLGSPAIPHLEYKRQLVAIARLPELKKSLQALEARLQALEATLRS